MRALCLLSVIISVMAVLAHCQGTANGNNIAKSSATRNSNIVQFSKKMYSSMGNQVGRAWNASAMAEGFKSEFDKLSASTGGVVGTALKAIYEMRMLDLQTSLTHARRLRDVLDFLDV
jgi:hypothetical protein